MDPKKVFRTDPRFRRQTPAATPLAPQTLTITVSFPDGGKQMQFSTDRPSNAIELAGIAMTLLQAQMQMMAQAIINKPAAPADRNAPHEYDVNADSEKSVQGFACGKCGQVADALIHLGTESDNPDLDTDLNPDHNPKAVS